MSTEVFQKFSDNLVYFKSSLAKFLCINELSVVRTLYIDGSYIAIDFPKSSQI